MTTTYSNQKKVIAKTHYNNRYVAVEGSIGDWACYIGKKSATVEYVKAYGDKISETEARRLFPEFEYLTWRA